MIGCLRTRVRKHPIVALYFESETVLKLYNLKALSFPSSLLSSHTKNHVFSQRCPYDLLPDDVTIFGSFYQLLTSYKTDADPSLYN